MKYKVELYGFSDIFKERTFHVFELPKNDGDKPFVVMWRDQYRYGYCDFCETGAGRQSCSCAHVKAVKRYLEKPEAESEYAEQKASPRRPLTNQPQHKILEAMLKANEPKYKVGDVVYFVSNDGHVVSGVIVTCENNNCYIVTQSYNLYAGCFMVRDEDGLAPSVDALLDSLKRKFEESK